MKAVPLAKEHFPNRFHHLSSRSSFSVSPSFSDMIENPKKVRFDPTVQYCDRLFSPLELYDSDPGFDSDFSVSFSILSSRSLNENPVHTPVPLSHLSSFSPSPNNISSQIHTLSHEKTQDATPVCTMSSTRDSTPSLCSNSVFSNSHICSTSTPAETTKKSENPIRWKGPKKIIRGQGANQLDIKLRLQDLTPNGKTLHTQALLDSGSTGSIIDSEFVKRHSLPTKPLAYPIPAINADGSRNSAGPITHVSELSMSIGDHTEKIMFAVARLGDHDIYLGFDWLSFHNPEVDWSRKKLYFTRCPSACNYHTHTIAPEDDEEEVERERVEKEEVEEQDLEGEDRLRTGDRVFMFNEESFQRSLKQQTQDEQDRNSFAKELISTLPKQIRDYWAVFGEPGHNERLPERRPWDHAIDLTPEFKSVKAKLYPVPKSQQAELDSFLEENLRNGQIRESKSPMSSPFFFIKKADGSLRPVQDYRKLNDMTVKNRYPLPLIGELLDKLEGAKYFSKVDIRWGFTNVRIKEGDEWKAAFLTNRGLYEPLVMFFGMCNAPATFQKMMNDIFKELIDEGKIIVYMDDILIFTETEKEHWDVVRRVLHLLAKHKLSLKVAKCEFCKPEIPFLGMIIGNGRICMDPKKTEAISDWPVLTSKKEVQQFLGFCNFYRRFIKDFSKIARPLTVLTGNTEFVWGKEQQSAFDTLKNALCTSPVLATYKNNLPLRVECDASDFALGAVLSQLQDEKWHPLAYFSKSLNETERNYEIYDKELMAILVSLEEWRQYLLSTEVPIEIWSDHQNLGYFREPQKLNRRQARWFSELQDYNFSLHHKAGSLMGKPDAITRRPDLDRGQGDNKDVVVLKAEYFRSVALRVTDIPTQSFATIYERVRKASGQKDSVVEKALESKEKGWVQRDDGVVEWKGRIYIPRHSVLREDLLMMYHDAPMAGHPGQYKMHELITRDYWWPGVLRDVKRYVNGCSLCQANKPLHRPAKIPLSPHDVPSAPWEVVSMDIIGPLPESKGKNAILVFVDMFTKRMRSLAITTKVTAIEVAELIRDHIFRNHGLPRKFVSDRGTQFVAEVARELYRLLGIEQNPSSAAHPQTDGQTERLNQEIEAFLRLYTNYRQDDWVDWLAIQEFCYNNRVSSATGYSPFFLESGRNPNMGFNPSRHSRNIEAQQFFDGMKESHENAQAAMRKAQEDMKRWYDRKSRDDPDYAIGTKVWLEATNLRLERPSRKLSEKRLGPFEVLEKIGQTSYKLKLPKTWKLKTPVFHASLLYPYTPPAFDVQKEPDPPPPVVIEDEEELEVEEVVDSRLRNGEIQYRVHWTGYPKKKDYTWEPLEHLENAMERVQEFHKKHPSAPRPINTRLLHFRPLLTTPDDLNASYDWMRGKSENIPRWSRRPP